MAGPESGLPRQPGLLRVLVAWSDGPRQAQEVTLELSASATLADALAQAGVQLLSTQEIGIWGHLANPNQVLRDGDRVEVYRALKVDPKVARRERFSQQGQGKSGLFANKRKGAATGY